MPLAEFLEAAAHQPFELINGERRPKLPNVSGHSEIIRLLFVALYLWSVQRAIGEVFAETTFVLPDADARDWVSGSRIPDIMMLDRQRVLDWKRATPDYAARPYPIIPDLVVEVVSPSDRYTEMNEKARLYLSDGVRLAWLVDPAGRNVAIHAAGADSPLVLRGDDAVLDGGDVLPGFSIALRDLFFLLSLG
jgi:Uma2 family endonuclease